jgi:hypothetical protein
MDKPLINKSYLLEKFPGKGGWTYAQIPEILQDRHAWFGWVKVSGSIDNYELKDFKLMPMGNGKLFLPVKAEIRKKIGKQAGDLVHVILYADIAPIVNEDDFMTCLSEESAASQTFHSLSEAEQKEYRDWIYAAKEDDTKVKRIAETLDRLSAGLKFKSK